MVHVLSKTNTLFFSIFLVAGVGIEPTRLSARHFECRMSAYFHHPAIFNKKTPVFIARKLLTVPSHMEFCDILSLIQRTA